MSGPDPRAVPDFLSLARLEGRAFVVLGAGQGIGRQTAHALAQAGARVACVDRDAALAEAVAGEVGGLPVVADALQREGVERAFAEAARWAGAVRGLVDIIGMPHIGPFLELDDERWRWQLDVVVGHAYLALQVGGRLIAEQGGGAIVCVGSISGLASVRGQTAYGAAKAALHHLVAGAARELAPRGVRVNAVAPGFVRTPRLEGKLDERQWAQVARIIPRGAPGVPAEIAAPILFLASDLASYITGQTLAVDGGLVGTIALPPDLLE